MKGQEYETLVADLVDALRRNTPLGAYTPGRGRGNGIKGASGYEHQIDLSLRDAGRLFLVEMKCWRKPVDLQAVLVLSARLRDIRDAEAGEVHASLVSTKHATSNAILVAAHLGIKIDIVRNPHEYALQFANQHFVGISEAAKANSSMEAAISRTCTQCGRRFTVADTEIHCAACGAV